MLLLLLLFFLSCFFFFFFYHFFPPKLDRLANSEANILEDKALITSLKETKGKSMTIAESLKESSNLQADLTSKREAYRPLSVMSGLLYFLLHGLESLNHMYQYSLPSFLVLFTRALNTAKKSSDLAERIGNMGRLLLDYTIINISRGMFKTDRLAFAFHLAHSVCPKAFGPGEWDHFLGRFMCVCA
jgi:dynein heavy chain 2